MSSNGSPSSTTYKFTKGLVLSIGGVCLGIGGSILTRQNLGLPSGYVHCAYKPSANVKSRLAGLKDESKEAEPEFPWKEFLKLLVPELLYLVGAVAVSKRQHFLSYPPSHHRWSLHLYVKFLDFQVDVVHAIDYIPSGHSTLYPRCNYTPLQKKHLVQELP